MPSKIDGWLLRAGSWTWAVDWARKAAHLVDRGFDAYGVDISGSALEQAHSAHPRVRLAGADVRSLPFENSRFDYLIDRGTFHYMATGDRGLYAGEAARVLRPGGRFLLRACLTAQGVRNDIWPQTLRAAFDGWQVVTFERRHIQSDTRLMPAFVLRLQRDRN